VRCQAIDDPNDPVGATLELEPGSRVTVDVLRNGKRQTVNVDWDGDRRYDDRPLQRDECAQLR